jgi:hypothetical protein
MKRSWISALSLCFLLLAVGCDKARSSAPPAPNFAGTWDVTFDDGVDVELRIGEQVLRGRVEGSAGSIEFRDAGRELVLQLDCSAPDLVCPSEVLARELTLDKPPGTLDADAVQLARPLAGLGSGACDARPGSFLTGEVLSSPGVNAKGIEAVALTSGRATILVDAQCLAPKAGLPKGSQVYLSTGFTAAKR